MPSVPPAIHERLERLAQQWQPARTSEAPLQLPSSSAEDPRLPGLDRRSWRVLLLLASMAFLLVGWMWWQGRTQSVAPIADHVVSKSTAIATAAPGDSALLVHVIGAVRKPGVVRLSTGSRVADALKAAGGTVSPKAESSVNLARLVVDGEQIQVNASGALASGSTAGKVSLNSGTLQQFEALPGVGPVLAQRILDYRTEYGPFRTVDQLDEVSGIGTALLGQLRAHVQM
ncbi:MAG: ComEA family DNA-binding protein [Actinomycetota bacterium]|nr:ComEA family DNA-binding protein [Actinomycetota bacterium]MDP2289472.1 ComEA family DNA-binding protein [Actinomycetota bacterium]